MAPSSSLAAGKGPEFPKLVERQKLFMWLSDTHARLDFVGSRAYIGP
jgi:hypothetical protein